MLRWEAAFSRLSIEAQKHKQLFMLKYVHTYFSLSNYIPLMTFSGSFEPPTPHTHTSTKKTFSHQKKFVHQSLEIESDRFSSVGVTMQENDFG
jgi:hypothetical protein